ncbi:efflux RND transporter periplasmic adaptor subunit [Rhizobium sp. FKY42]|uniref:efflux RND transporter periplasmic adaptor subunit n=1 Tax=Rhizobium sp. FKY42 TaxID=2562310 RepID=UPI0010C0DAD4|nr:efflux RND transporter periplasmic adaptor subunit [Rhizobium sp. FKY42]
MNLESGNIKISQRLRRNIRFLCYALPVIGFIAIGGRAMSVPAQNPDLRYAFATAAVGSIEKTIPATGKISPRYYVDVGAQVSGQLRALHVTAGERVQQGQLLAEIDAEVQAATVEGIQADLDRLKAELAEQVASQKFAKSELDRSLKLLETNAIAQTTREAAERDYQVLAARVDATNAKIRQTDATLRAERATMGRARIVAPMAGTVVSLDARVGQTLNANYDTPLILRIADLSVVTVAANVSEADIPKLREGMPVWFTTLGEPDRRIRSKVRQIMPAPPRAPDNKDGDGNGSSPSKVVLYHVLFDVPNDKGSLKSDMTAQVNFVVEESQNTFILPVAALDDAARVSQIVGDARNTEKIRVFHEDGSIELREVEVGVTNRFSFEVRKGLKAGERVVTGERQAKGRSLLWFEL